MPADSDRAYEALLAEVDAVRRENARLRGLLGLDSRGEDGHAVSWSPMLLTDSLGAADPVDSSSPWLAKVELLWSLFGARSDVYAVRWESASSGKSGWQPATKSRWSKGRAPRDYLPLTDDVFEAHLAGGETVGIYPLLRGDQCALLVCDFDRGTWALDALAYLDACHANGVPAVLERSRSGNGAHVWVFFDGGVAATDARAMGAALLRLAMAARAELDLSSYDRFFPSQDFLPKAGFGNLIALPLHGECVERGTTVFLNPATMEPWPDQWAFLSSVARLAPVAVSALAESLRPAAARPALSLADLAASGRRPPPPVVRARLGAMLSGCGGSAAGHCSARGSSVAHPGPEDELELGGDAAREGDEEQASVEAGRGAGDERITAPEDPPVEVFGAAGVALAGVGVDGDAAVGLVSLERRRFLEAAGFVAQVEERAGELEPAHVVILLAEGGSIPAGGVDGGGAHDM